MVLDSIWRIRSRVTPNILADLFERARPAVGEAEPQPDDFRFALGERSPAGRRCSSQQRGRVTASTGEAASRVLDEIAERGSSSSRRPESSSDTGSRAMPLHLLTRSA